MHATAHVNRMSNAENIPRGFYYRAGRFSSGIASLSIRSGDSPYTFALVLFNAYSLMRFNWDAAPNEMHFSKKQSTKHLLPISTTESGMEISVRQSQCANACSQIRSNLEFGLNEIRLRLVQE